jgi:hypothetical protein
VSSLILRRYRWSVDNGLLFTGKKTQAMIMCKDQGRLPSHVPELRLPGDLVVYTYKVMKPRYDCGQSSFFSGSGQ